MIVFQFCILTMLAMGLYLASGGWALWLKPRLSGELESNMLATIQEYDTVNAYQQNWDALHGRVRKTKWSTLHGLWTDV